MPVAQVRDIDIYYETAAGHASDCVDLLFISGTGGDLRNKPNQFDSPLKQNFNLLSYDQRGLGQSAKPDGAYSMADYADDAAALMDVLGFSSMAVMGVSFGGMVAQELALRHPNKVSSLVLACTSSGGLGGASYPLHELHEHFHDDPEGLLQANLQLADNRRTDAWVERHPEQWARLLELSRTARRPLSTDEDRQGAWRQLQARKGHNTWDRLDQIRVPTLIAAGEFDDIAPVANQHALHAQIPDSELLFFAGGHLFLVQDKTAYPTISQWLLDKQTVASNV